MEFGIDILAMLFAAAFIAAFIDAIAGGGGLITIPALLMTGMPPAIASINAAIKAAAKSIAKISIPNSMIKLLL